MNQNLDPNKRSQSYQSNQQPSSYPYLPQGLTNNSAQSSYFPGFSSDPSGYNFPKQTSANNFNTKGLPVNNFGQPLQNSSYNNFNLDFQDIVNYFLAPAQAPINEDYRPSHDLLYFRDFEQVYQNSLMTRRNFVDPAFLPGESSLMERINSNHSSDWAKLKWLRPYEFMKARYYIFKSPDDAVVSKSLRKDPRIQIDDVFQGNLEDSYFLSCLSSMAENPSRIRNLFISKKVNQTCGVYCVKICFEGIWQAVFVDDYFPCISEAIGPCFAKSKKGENELWVLILEKAWAKLFGSYERIEFGESREVLRDLTGAPTKSVQIVTSTSEEMNVLRQIYAGVKEDYIMTARTREKKSLYNTKKRREMFQNHSYSLISIHQLNRVILIKLRTPYGVGEWMGAWRDDDPVWNTISASDKENVGYIKNNSDGIFFMRSNDFVKTFEYVDICMVRDNYKYCAIPLNVQRGKVCVEINVTTGGEYFFTILQPSSKINDENYSPAKISIMRNQILINKNQELAQRETYIQTHLNPGVYEVSCEYFLKVTGKCVLSSYGVGDVSFRIIDDQMNYEFQKQMPQIERNMRMEMDQKKIIEDQMKYEYQTQMLQMEGNRRMEKEIKYEVHNQQPHEMIFRNTGFKSREKEKKQEKEMDCSSLGKFIVYILLFGVLAVIFGQVFSTYSTPEI